MSKREFISKLEKIICDYCRNIEEYEDVFDDFSFSFKGNFYNVKVEIDKETTDSDE